MGFRLALHQITTLIRPTHRDKVTPGFLYNFFLIFVFKPNVLPFYPVPFFQLVVAMSFSLAHRPTALVFRRHLYALAPVSNAATKGKYQVTSQPYDSPTSTDDMVNGEFWTGEPGIKQQREEAIYKSFDSRPTLDLMARAHHINATQDDV